MTRRLPALLMAGAAAVVLSGCGSLEKPVPLVTLFSGGEVVKSDAGRWCFDEAAVGEGDCRVQEVNAPVLEFRPGDIVTISVDKDLTDRRWAYFQALASDPEQRLSSEVKDDYSLGFVGPGATEDVILRVVALQGRDGQDQQASGEWTFVLRPKT